MLNAVEFLQAKSRMCSSYVFCHNCPLEIHETLKIDCDTFIADNSKVAVQLVEDWLENEHKITNLDKFNKLFKNQPWRDYVSKLNCYATECGSVTPCTNCPWWKEEYKEV